MRSREEVIWDFVQQWLNKAEGDLAAAESDLLAAGIESIRTDTVERGR